MVDAPHRQLRDLANEYTGLVQTGTAPHGITYRAQNGLGEDARIIEIFDANLCQRDASGATSARPHREQDWAALLSATEMAIVRMSRLAHPALLGLDQIVRANGTIYLATVPDRGQTVEQIGPAFADLLSPAEIEAASKNLIDLLAYLHAFDVTGMAIRPEVLVYDDQRKALCLLLRPFLDGTRPRPGGSPKTTGDDCIALAETLHTLITGNPPATPYVPLKTRAKGYSHSFIAALDRVLMGKAPPSARAWANACHGRVARRPAPWTFIALVAMVCAIVLGTAAWFNAPSDAPDPEMAIQKQVQGAGPWHVDVPLQVVRQNGQFALSVTHLSPGFATLNPWIQDGLIVTAINGAPITQPVDLRDMVLAGRDAATSASLTSITLRDPALPLERSVAVTPFVWRAKTYGAVAVREQVTPDGWQLVITTLQENAPVPLRVGDVLLAEEVIGRKLLRLSDLERALEDVQTQPHPSLTILIHRDGSRLVVGFAAQALLDP